MKIKNKGFTLVELIVVITILAILGTIAFISLQGFSREARNATRATDLKNIETVVGLYQLKEGQFPVPSNGEQITYSGSEVWTQGTFGEYTRKLLGSRGQISEVPTDPLTGSEYTYSVLNTKQEMQIAGVFEGDYYGYNNLNKLNKTHAAGEYGTTYITGNYNGKVAKTKSGTTIYVLAVPSIINGDKTLTDIIDIINNKKLAFPKGHILPSSYSGQTVFQEQSPTKAIVNQPIVVYETTDINTLQDETNQETLIDNLKTAYENTAVENQDSIKTIVNNPTLYTAQTLIKNEINPSVEVTASNTTTGTTPTAGPDLTGKCSISQDPNVTVSFDSTYINDTSYYGTGFYIQSNTCLKWQAQTGLYGLKWASGSTDSGDDNYYANYSEPVWNGSSYTYNLPNGGVDTDYQAFKYCESIGSGWRLPTKKELFSIMTDINSEKNSSGKYTQLPSITQFSYWSSTAYAYSSSSAWHGYFNYGSVNNSNKSDTYKYTLCVHD